MTVLGLMAGIALNGCVSRNGDKTISPDPPQRDIPSLKEPITELAHSLLENTSLLPADGRTLFFTIRNDTGQYIDTLRLSKNLQERLAAGSTTTFIDDGRIDESLQQHGLMKEFLTPESMQMVAQEMEVDLILYGSIEEAVTRSRHRSRYRIKVYALRTGVKESIYFEQLFNWLHDQPVAGW